jgi:hypothetical protein
LADDSAVLLDESEEAAGEIHVTTGIVEKLGEAASVIERGREDRFSRLRYAQGSLRYFSERVSLASSRDGAPDELEKVVVVLEGEPSAEEPFDDRHVEAFAVEAENHVGCFKVSSSSIQGMLIVKMEATRGTVPENKDRYPAATSTESVPTTHVLSEPLCLNVEDDRSQL